MAQGAKFPCVVGCHAVYLGPLGNIAQSVQERETECLKHNEHKVL